MWLALPFTVASSFNEFFRKWEKLVITTWYKFFAIISFALPESIRFNIDFCFKMFCQTSIFQLPSIIRKKTTYGTQFTRNQIVRQKKRCSAGTLYCTQCANFSIASQDDLIYHIAKKHTAQKPVVTSKCKLCYEEFPGFYVLRQHKNGQNGFPSRQQMLIVNKTLSKLMMRKLKRNCVHVNISLEVLGLNMRETQSLQFCYKETERKNCGQKLDHFFNNLNCAVKVNLAFGFISWNKKDGGFSYFYSHENNTLLDRSKHVCTRDDLPKPKYFSTKLTSKSLVAEKNWTKSGSVTRC